MQRRTVTISAARTARSLGYKVPSLTNVFSTKALVSGPAHYQSPKQRVTRWMIDLATLNSPLAPALLSPIASPESVYSPSGSPSVSRFSLSVFSSSISSATFSPVTPATTGSDSASFDLEADLDRMHQLIADVEAQDQLSSLFSSTISQPSNDSITLYTNTSGSAQTWNSQAESNSDLPVLSPCVRLDVSPAAPASFEWSSLDSLTTPPASPASDIFASLLPVPATHPVTPSSSSDSTVSFIPSPSFDFSIESVQYRSIPVFTTVAPFVASIPGSWIEDDCSWADIVKPATVFSVAVAAVTFAASFFW